MRRSVSIGLIVLGVLLAAAGGLFWLAWEGSLPAKRPDVYVGCALPDLTLTTPWNGGKVEVPPPAVLPDAARKTRGYRKWVRCGYISQLTYRESDGSTYVADLMAIAEANGRTRELIPKVEIHRPDGTLETETVYSPDCLPNSWKVYDTDGRTVRASVVAETYPAPSIRSMTVFPPDASARRYDVNPDGTVRLEWECREDGSSIRVLNRAVPKGENENPKS